MTSLLLSLILSAGVGDIEWLSSFSDGLRKARIEGKIIFLVLADWD